MLISNALTVKLFISTFLEQRLQVNKTDIVNSIDELVKQNAVINNKKNNSDYDSFFPYNDNQFHQFHKWN